MYNVLSISWKDKILNAKSETRQKYATLQKQIFMLSNCSRCSMSSYQHMKKHPTKYVSSFCLNLLL